MNRIEGVEVAEPDEDQEGVEVGGDAEREERRGASGKAVERQLEQSKTVTSRRMRSNVGARRMMKVPKRERTREVQGGCAETKKVREERKPRNVCDSA